jgi:pyruvate dehydrogenase E2 component (dihydrolipoamide acetyltransferase)
LAAKANADYADAVGTGPNGRIIERDIDALLKNGAPQRKAAAAAVKSDLPEFTDEKISNVRKVIAKAMVASLTAMAQLTQTASFDATDIMKLRARLKESKDEAQKGITLNDFVLYAVSRVLKKHPLLNAHFLDDKIRFFNPVHLGMAVDTDRGLLVPTIQNADGLSLSGIGAAAKKLAAGAQGGSLNPDLLRGATFTVSNLGTFGIESFTPIVNPPQIGILGVNTITTRVKSDGTPYQSMALSLTFDHRAVDGAPAARFLSGVCKYLESFTFNLAAENI